MPFIDEERGVVVLRIVYDGPPFSGKTTTLRTLSRGLNVKLVTPAEENGRTLYFDWAEYVGGLFEGLRIRCQIVSVPGQQELAERRRALIDSADAVVFVGDTREGQLSATLELLEELTAHCREQEPPVGVVLQANKRDAPNAGPIEHVREKVTSIAPIPVKETVATDGNGVREAFVFGVRLALDRVRALADAGRLAMARPEIDGPGELLRSLQSLAARERDAAPFFEAVDASEPLEAPSALGGEHSPGEHATNDLAMDHEPRFAPDPLMPGGLIWPPVDGRALLHEVSSLGLTPERRRDGSWWASGEGWRFHSAKDALYESTNAGRAALIAWARVHASSGRLISPGRVLLLDALGDGRHRLWQLVRVRPALREWLEDRVARGSVEETAQAVLAAARRLAEARAVFTQADLDVPCSLWTLGDAPSGQLVYVSLMPEASGAEARAPIADSAEPLGRELTSVIRMLRRERRDFPVIAARLSELARTAPGDEPARALAEVASQTLAEWYGSEP